MTVVLASAVMPLSAEVVTGRHSACHDPLWLERILVAAEAKDKAAYEAFFDRGKCVLLRPGMQVTVKAYYQSPADEPRVAFVFKGFTLYAQRIAVAKSL